MSASLRAIDAIAGETADVRRSSGEDALLGCSGGINERFLELECLGEGPRGVVYRVYDVTLRREVALEVLSTDALEHEAQMSLLHETQAMAQLSHPNVVAIYDVTYAAGRVAVAMEYVAGQTLSALLQEDVAGSRHRWREIVRLFIGAGRGLAAAHKVGVTHRNFRPSNALVCGEGEVKVKNFGVTGGSSALYIAPEQHANEDAGAAADQYAYCVALWEALCGAPPFAADCEGGLEAAKRCGPPQWPRHAKVPREIVVALRRGLAPRPVDRFPSMSALLECLALSLRRRNPVHAIVAASVVVAVGGSWLWMLTAERSALCEGAELQLAGTWDAPTRQRVEAAVLATERAYARETWSRVDTLLQDYTTDWAAQYGAACRATAVEGKQSADVLDLRMGCLHRARIELRAAVDLLRRPDAEIVQQAVKLVSALPSLGRCENETALRQDVPAPDDPDVAAQVERVRTALAEARAAQLGGKYDAASKRVAAAEELLRDVDYPPIEAELGFLRGRIREDQGQYAAAADDLDEALQMALRLGMHELSSAAVMQLAHVVGQQLNRYDESLRLAQMAIELARGVEERLEAEAGNVLGTVLSSLGRLEEAEDLLRRVLADSRRSFGDADALVALVRSSLTTVLHVQGRYAEAEAELRLVLESDIARLGAEHPRVVQARDNLGLMLIERGLFREGEEQLRLSVALSEKALGPQHPDTLEARLTLARALMQQGRFADAEPDLRSTLLALRGVYGEEHFQTASCRNHLGIALHRIGRSAEAETELRQSLAMLVKLLGPDHSAVASARNDLASVLLESGNFVDAEAEFRRALAAAGPPTRVTAVVHHNLGIICARLGRYDEAAAELQRAIQIYQGMLGDEHPLTVHAVHTLGEVSLLLGQDDVARELFERAWRFRAEQQVLPEERAVTALALAKMLWPNRAERGRAMELARIAETEAKRADNRGRELADEIRRWLKTHR